MTFDQMYEDVLIKALKKAGTAEGAANLMGVSIRTVERWKKKYGIYFDDDVGRYRADPKQRKFYDKRRTKERASRIARTEL